MKKIAFLFILIYNYCDALQAQVKIGGAAAIPHASAVLELDGGNNRGLLLPRMRKMDIDAIVNPAEGLTIYATDEQAVYLRKSGAWEKQAPFSLPFTATLASPSTLLDISNTGETGFPSAIRGYSKNTIGLLGVSDNYIGVYGSAGSQSAIGGYFGNSWGGAAIATLGRTGIGTLNPTALLHIDNTNSPGSNMILNDKLAATFQLQNAGVNKGYLQTDVNDMVVATNFANNTGKIIMRTGDADRLIVDNNGHTGIGAPSIGARLYVDAMATSATAMVLNDQSPTLQLQNAGVDKGFMQVVGNDLRMGTNAANTTGNILMRTKGTDRMRIDSAGIVSIGIGGSGNYSLDYSALNIHGGPLTIDDDNFPAIIFKDTYTNPNNENLLGVIAFNSFNMTFNASNRGFQFTDLNGKRYLTMQQNTGYTNIEKRLGISTENPTAKFFINGIDDAATAMVINDNDPLIQLQQTGVSKGYIQLDANDLVLATNISNNTGKVVLRNNNVDRLLVNPDGRLIVGSPTGTSPAGSQMLKIRGGVQATDFTVTALAAWPDYVFADDYKLKSLEETEAFIKANKHLPNIPAAAVIEKEGFALGDMQKRMMEKIEELTLHLIEANKNIQTQKVEMEELKKQMATISNKN